MVRRARPREQSSSLAVKLWSIALAAGLPGTLVIVMSGSVGPGAAIAGVGVTLGLSGVALAIGLHTLVTTRLRLVAGALRRIAEGDFTRRFGTRGGDDIASVMRTLDEVGGRLQSRSASLQTAERRYRLLYEHGPAALFRTRLDGRVIDCNPAAARLLGYESVNDAKAQNAARFYADPGDRAVVIERLRRHGVLANLPLAFRRQDGRRIPVLLTLMQTQEDGETDLDSVAVEISDDRREDDARAGGGHVPGRRRAGRLLTPSGLRARRGRRRSRPDRDGCKTRGCGSRDRHSCGSSAGRS